jgi:hypothetical protein
VLTASAALPLIAVAGCRGVGALAAPPAQAPDVGVLKAAIAGEELMIARYEGVLAGARHRDRGLAAALEPILAQHRAHLTQLRSSLVVPAGAATPAPSRSAARPGKPVGPGQPAAAFAFLRAAEQHASDVLLSYLGAVPASLAQLLASISASEATHAAVLRPGGRAGPMCAPESGAAVSAPESGTAVSALQTALSAEHAAVYGYGVIGAHLTGSARAAASRDWVAHQMARDDLEAMLGSFGAQPVAAAPAYRLPAAVRTAHDAVTLAVSLEDQTATAYLGLVAASTPAIRQAGARWLRATAWRAAFWRGTTVAFPGLPASVLGRRPAPRRPGSPRAGSARVS